MIASCAFGKMVIDGKTFTSDLIIFPDGKVVDSWWRKNGHVLSLPDIETLLDKKPELIIAGTGINGRMRPEPGLADLLRKKNISFTALENKRAIKTYNESLSLGKKVGACFHLTC